MKLTQVTLEVGATYQELIETRSNIMLYGKQRLKIIDEVVSLRDPTDYQTIQEIVVDSRDRVDELNDIISELDKEVAVINEEIEVLNDYFLVLYEMYGVDKTVESTREVLSILFSVGIKVSYSMLGNGNVNINLDSLRPQ